MNLKTIRFLILFAVSVVHCSFAQETIKGVVTDSSAPIPGVLISIKNQQTSSTMSDFDGNFVIEAKKGDVLVFTYVGMITLEKIVGNESILNIVMEEDIESLDEVVVTAMGIKRQKSSIGSATTTVGYEELTKGSQIDIANSIKGKVAGVVISSSSTDPGASSGIIIRGFSTIEGSNQPLYVIDGVPVNDGSTFSDSLNGAYDFGRGSGEINPDDIESITIIKGASSAALYGARAANGVVLITTKKGKGKLKVNVSSSYFVSDVLRVPKYQDQFGQGWDGQHYLNENGSWGPSFDGKQYLWGNVDPVTNSQKIKEYSFQKDQLRNFFDTGISTINNISISGGSGETSTRLSFGNNSSDGIFPTSADSNERNTLAVSFNSKMDKVTFGGTLNYVNIKGSAVASGQGSTVYNNLMQIPNDINITEFEDYNNAFNNVSNYYTPYGITNPYFTLNEDGARFEKNRVYGGANIAYEINKWSNLSYKIGIDQSSSKTKIWTAIIDAVPGSPNDGSSTEQAGSYEEIDNFAKQINHDILYNINLDLDEDLELASTFGYNYNERTTSSIGAAVTSQDIPDFYTISNSSSPTTVTQNGTEDDTAVLGTRRIFGILNSTTLSYKNQLFLTTNIRNDWSSTLPKDNQSILYGGINSSWIFTKTFPEIKDVINYGKFRLGYGETGVDTNPYQIESVFVLGSTDNQGFRDLNFPVGGVNAWEVGNRAANPDLKPERRKEFEIGAELSFFKNRFNVDFSYYNAIVEDQILLLPFAPSSGYTSQRANIGSISNKGFELLLNVNIFKDLNGFKWNTTFNYATNDGVVEELDDRIDKVDLGGLSTTSLVLKEGQPLALLEGSVPLKDPSGNLVVDVNGIPIASSEKEIYGDTQYDYTLGITNNFSYKGFSLGASLDIRQGGLMFSRTADITRFTGNSIVTTINDRKPYLIPGSVTQEINASGETIYVENTTPIDTEHWDDYYRADANGRDNVIDKSFVKLREVVISYDFSKKLLDKTFFNDLSISLIGRNLLLFTPASNQFIDPETSSFGTDLRAQFGEFSSSPSTKSFGITLKAGF